MDPHQPQQHQQHQHRHDQHQGRQPSRTSSVTSPLSMGLSGPAVPDPRQAHQAPAVMNLTPFQMSQRGLLQPLKQAVEAGFHVDTPDEEGITCMHWCAINNRVDCVRFLLSEGAKVDPAGGELQATPLHWAIRQGHLRIVTLLVNHGADISFKDAQGYNPLHVAAQFGFMPIAAYLVARGADVNAKDDSGRTPLIWAATKAFSSDLIRCLIALDASLNLRDEGGNTALHYAVAANNMFAVVALTQAGASKDVKNEQGLSPTMLVHNPPSQQQQQQQHAHAHGHGHSHHRPNRQLAAIFPSPQQERVEKALGFWRKDPMRRIGLLVLPLVGLSAIGFALTTFQASVWWALLYLGVALWLWVVTFRLFNHGYKPGQAPTSMAVYVGTKLLFAATTFYLYWPAVFSDGPLLSLPMKMVVAVVIFVLTYSFHKAHTMDPGYIRPDRSSRSRVIIDLAEREELNANNFCPTCAIWRPLRSKHSAVTNKCVAKFDHYCPFVDNDVGADNHHHFLNFLIFFVAANVLFLYYSFQYMYHASPPPANVLHAFAQWWTYSPWVMFLLLQCCVHLTWVTLLTGMQLKQIAITGLTTNEEINMWKYEYLQGYRRSPWHRGIVGNLVELYAHSTDWKTVYATPAQLQQQTLARVRTGSDGSADGSDVGMDVRAPLLPPAAVGATTAKPV